MPRNKLQIDQVIEILTTQAHIPSRQVAQKYGVCRTTITHLRRGWSWKNELSVLQTVGILPKSAWGINKEPISSLVVLIICATRVISTTFNTIFVLPTLN